MQPRSGETTTSRSGDITELARLADDTDGCLTIAQLRAAGYSKREIATLTRRGIVRRVFIGVYVLARTTSRTRR